jgi:MFS family permease
MAAYLILSAVVFLSFFANGSTWPFLPLYAESLGASLVNISWIVGTFSVFNLVSNLLWGRLADRVGRRKPFIVGTCATLILTNFLVAQAQVWWVILPLRLFEGVALGAYSVASLAMMGDILEGNPNRARMIGAYRMSGSLAFSIAIVSAGLIARDYGFRTTYTLAAGIYLIAFLIALNLPEARERPRSRVARQVSFSELLRGPMLPLLVVAASFSIPFQAVFSVWPIWVADVLGLGRDGFSQLWGLAAFVEVPCMAIAGLLTDRFGRRLTFLLGLTLFASVYVMYYLVAVGTLPVGGLVFAQVVRGFAFASFTATALTMVIEISPPASRGRAAGLFNIAQSLSQIVGNYSGGPVAQGFGYPTLFAGAAAALSIGVGYVSVAVKPAASGEGAAESAQPAART